MRSNPNGQGRTANELDDFCRRTCTGVYGISAVYGNGEVEHSRI